MITYSAPITLCSTSKCEVIGVLTIDISINQLERYAEGLISNSDGFPAITYANGLYIYHPDKSYVKNKLTLLDVARNKCDFDRVIASQDAKLGQSRTLNHISKTTGENSWYMIHAFSQLGWSMQNTFYQSTALEESEVSFLRQQIIIILSLIITSIAFLLLFILQLTKWQATTLWLATALFSSIIILFIGVIWGLALNNTKPKNSEDTPITSSQTIEQSVTKYKQVNLKANDIEVIPTGIQIDTMELKDSHKVDIGGMIWQRFPIRHCDSDLLHKTYITENKYGVMFKNSQDVKMLLHDAQINCNDKYYLVTWQFDASVFYEFNYSRFPLEIEYIDIHLTAKKDDLSYILVPDIASYKFGSNRKIGLDKNLFIAGWKIFRAYFALSPASDHGTTFGKKQNFDNHKFDELHLKVGVKRVFLDAFISNLTPLIVVAIILFSITLLPKDIDISRILGLCVSMFLVVVFSHLAIRRNIAAGELFYLEYFYFAIYGLLILVPVDAFRVALNIPSKTLSYQNGILYKALYWPTLLLAIYLITVKEFY
ncbi:cache domain-containing protein [Thalassotalea sp. LPB0316]|uniref:cache domain-containing protein n=1 Tax=Thalassotalea sp. LPB0316 TaxID=2769490 RepID=UPI0018696C19|nr:cache domain-containing protein [Thalassotalea sp. LPB0316]QOL25222.1 cache domain-containing protein [Thalassotalea sp. LPB0316]